MLSYLNKLFRLLWRQDMGEGAAAVAPAPSRPVMPAVVATAAIEIFPTAPAAEPKPAPVDRMLAARLVTVARLNPPKSRSRQATKGSAEPGSKPIPSKGPQTLKRQPPAGPVRKTSTRTASLAVRPSADIIDLSAARHARRPASRSAA